LYSSEPITTRTIGFYALVGKIEGEKHQKDQTTTKHESDSRKKITLPSIQNLN